MYNTYNDTKGITNMENWKHFIFESTEKTLYETDNFDEMRDYIYNFIENYEELIFDDIYNSINYITIHFHGYNLMIKK